MCVPRHDFLAFFFGLVPPGNAPDVVEGHVDKQKDHKRNSDLLQPHFVACRQIPAGNAFDGEQGEMAAIERGNGQQVDDAQVNAQHRKRPSGAGTGPVWNTDLGIA